MISFRFHLDVRIDPWQLHRTPRTSGASNRVPFETRNGFRRFDAAANTVTVNLEEVLNAETGLPDFGRPTTASNTLFGPRDMQLGVKLTW